MTEESHFPEPPPADLSNLRHAIIADAKRARVASVAFFTRYQYGGGWGNRIIFSDAERTRVVGWKPRIPQVGDILEVGRPTRDGVDLYRFTSVEPCDDPRDMFCGTVKRADFPFVEGSFLFLADGARYQMRILDLLYFRLGITNIAALERAYKAAP